MHRLYILYNVIVSQIQIKAADNSQDGNAKVKMLKKRLLC